jgi:hypothetical protein
VSALIVHVRTFPAPTLVTAAGEIDLLTAPGFASGSSQGRLLAAAGLHALLEQQDRYTRQVGNW